MGGRCLVGARIEATGRRGKLLVLPLSSGALLGLRFGMTGRLVVDGSAPIERLLYSGVRFDPSWERFGLDFDDGGELVVVDPRRLGGVELDPDLDDLGPEASTVTTRELARALGSSTAPVKAVLLDQHRLAGLGNLLVDESLWRAVINPGRPARSLDATERSRLARSIRSTVALLDRRGGSHMGDLQAQRRPGGHCPRCGEELVCRRIGGRTTWSCPVDQASL